MKKKNKKKKQQINQIGLYKTYVKINVKYYNTQWPPVWEIAVLLAVAGDVNDGVFLCCPFPHEMSLMRSGT